MGARITKERAEEIRSLRRLPVRQVAEQMNISVATVVRYRDPERQISDQRGGHHTPPLLARRIKRLLKAGGSRRQVMELCGVAGGPIARLVHDVREETECSHGLLRHLCRPCSGTRIIETAELAELCWPEDKWILYNVWLVRHDGSKNVYRIVKSKAVAEEEVKNLKRADPRCGVASAYFNKFDPDNYEGVS